MNTALSNVELALEVSEKLCREFEGLSLEPYICPAGYPTIGYGTVYKPDGTKVTMQHPPISASTAEEWLVGELRRTYLKGVIQVSPNLLWYPKILGALTDFAYNLGVPRYRASTLKRKVNEENWEGAHEELMRWVHAGGKRLPGLVRRRKAEAEYLPEL